MKGLDCDQEKESAKNMWYTAGPYEQYKDFNRINDWQG